jgi:hypothetical protein
VVEDVEIDDGAEVVHVGDKEVLFSRRKEFVNEARVGDGIVQIAVAGRVPGFGVSSAMEPRGERDVDYVPFSGVVS